MAWCHEIFLSSQTGWYLLKFRLLSPQWPFLALNLVPWGNAYFNSAHCPKSITWNSQGRDCYANNCPATKTTQALEFLNTVREAEKAEAREILRDTGELNITVAKEREEVKIAPPEYKAMKPPPKGQPMYVQPPIVIVQGNDTITQEFKYNRLRAAGAPNYQEEYIRREHEAVEDDRAMSQTFERIYPVRAPPPPKPARVAREETIVDSKDTEDRSTKLGGVGGKGTEQTVMDAQKANPQVDKTVQGQANDGAVAGDNRLMFSAPQGGAVQVQQVPAAVNTVPQQQGQVQNQVQQQQQQSNSGLAGPEDPATQPMTRRQRRRMARGGKAIKIGEHRHHARPKNMPRRARRTRKHNRGRSAFLEVESKPHRKHKRSKRAAVDAETESESESEEEMESESGEEVETESGSESEEEVESEAESESEEEVESEAESDSEADSEAESEDAEQEEFDMDGRTALQREEDDELDRMDEPDHDGLLPDGTHPRGSLYLEGEAPPTDLNSVAASVHGSKQDSYAKRSGQTGSSSMSFMSKRRAEAGSEEGRPHLFGDLENDPLGADDATIAAWYTADKKVRQETGRDPFSNYILESNVTVDQARKALNGKSPIPFDDIYGKKREYVPDPTGFKLDPVGFVTESIKNTGCFEGYSLFRGGPLAQMYTRYSVCAQKVYHNSEAPLHLNQCFMENWDSFRAAWERDTVYNASAKDPQKEMNEADALFNFCCKQAPKGREDFMEYSGSKQQTYYDDDWDYGELRKVSPSLSTSW